MVTPSGNVAPPNPAPSVKSSSVLIPSYNRPHHLVNCLRGLAAQALPPDEVLVVWQGDDTPTRDAAEGLAASLPYPLRVVHSTQRGVVPAENAALDASSGEIVVLIDDDAVPAPDWLRRHMAFYDDPTVGAVGGPARSFEPDGTPFPRRQREPIGVIRWYGRSFGNMYDQVPEWRTRPPRQVDHLVGYNMSLRRCAFDRFESSLRAYWNLFEMEVCLQVAARGYRVMFDFGNVVDHFPTNTAYVGGRHGDLQIKVVNPSFNEAFIHARWAPAHLVPLRIGYFLLGGIRNRPGLLMAPMAMLKFGHPIRELKLLCRSMSATLAGWRAGTNARKAAESAARVPNGATVG